MRYNIIVKIIMANTTTEEVNNPYISNSIFWVDVGKIRPNPYQPRRDFDEARLKDMADSIRAYGILQPLTVTRKELFSEDGLSTEYELIAGERRLRASKIAGVLQVPVIIKADAESDKIKLELAIIENLQREDISSLDRSIAFDKLHREFGLKHIEIAKKIGKSREYVSNTIRLLMLPDEMKNALRDGKINEGHTRPLLMLGDRPEEQMTLFKEIVIKRLSVREAERISRKIAYDKARKKEYVNNPELLDLEERLTEKLGTRVQIEPKDFGGRVTIDYFSTNDLRNFLDLVKGSIDKEHGGEMKFDNPDNFLGGGEQSNITDSQIQNIEVNTERDEVSDLMEDKDTDNDTDKDYVRDDTDDNLYSINNFSV